MIWYKELGKFYPWAFHQKHKLHTQTYQDWNKYWHFAETFMDAFSLIKICETLCKYNWNIFRVFRIVQLTINMALVQILAFACLAPVITKDGLVC